MGSDCTGAPARSETPVGSREDDESLSSRTICAPWRYAPDPKACWLRASAGLRARHTSRLWWVEARRVAIWRNLIGTSPHLPRLEPCLRLSPYTAQHLRSVSEYPSE